MLLKIIKIIKQSKIKFFTPSKVDLIIFDDENLGPIEKIIKNTNYFILQTRPERIRTLFLSIRIIFLTIIFFRGNLLSSYLISLIKITEPKVVVTYIDNSLKFSEIAARFQFLEKKIKFLAIQNGARYEYLENQYLYKNKYVKKNLNKNFFIPILLSFGKYEKDKLKKLKINAKKIIPVGSLALEDYMKYKKLKKIKIKKKKQICLLSDHGAWNQQLAKKDKNIEKRFVLLTEFCLKYARKKNYKILVCQKRPKNKKLNKAEYKFSDQYLEKSSFKKFLPRKYYKLYLKCLLKRGNNKFETYLNMEKSEILISSMSTMLRENLYLRNKIFAVNLTGNKIYDFPKKNFYTFSDNNYFRFEKKLSSLIKMKNSDYFKKAEKDADYFLKKNSSPRKEVSQIINKLLSN